MSPRTKFNFGGVGSPVPYDMGHAGHAHDLHTSTRSGVSSGTLDTGLDIDLDKGDTLKEFQIILRIPDKWVDSVDDLKELLESECNIWAVTHCEPDLHIIEIRKGAE